ncbi:hypothetical protein [Plebeiibacterium sediminum]|uniref:Uncharacterized protein n=1 Tax=Plebeiibacterium sediminum TaxID=2992112 RepID=A0AAE3M677_9BACT|nr:hypothetical protein [Plebeiobacterium sediminum]MCW3787692.1 hypothetical protein [Plebeiobacterium sediminum]
MTNISIVSKNHKLYNDSILSVFEPRGKEDAGKEGRLKNIQTGFQD